MIFTFKIFIIWFIICTFGLTNEIKVFEYSNAGENYTTASATITGAGADASVEYTDFREVEANLQKCE